MRNIAIFVSGEGEASERIIRLFNEGNRLRTVLVVTDDSAASLIGRLENRDLTAIHIPDAEWEEKAPEVADLLKANEVQLVVLDNFVNTIPQIILDAVDG